MKPAPPVTSARMRAPEATSPLAGGAGLSSSSARRGYRVIQRRQARSDDLRGRAATGGDERTSARGRVLGDRTGGCGQRSDVARRDERDVVLQLGQRAAAGRDDGQARGQRLDGGEAEGLVRA